MQRKLGSRQSAVPALNPQAPAAYKEERKINKREGGKEIENSSRGHELAAFKTSKKTHTHVATLFHFYVLSLTARVKKSAAAHAAKQHKSTRTSSHRVEHLADAHADPRHHHESAHCTHEGNHPGKFGRQQRSNEESLQAKKNKHQITHKQTYIKQRHERDRRSCVRDYTELVKSCKEESNTSAPHG